MNDLVFHFLEFRFNLHISKNKVFFC